MFPQTTKVTKTLSYILHFCIHKVANCVTSSQVIIVIAIQPISKIAFNFLLENTSIKTCHKLINEI